jgi:hypothetical protein
VIDDYDVYNGPGSPAIWIRMKPVVDKGIAYSPLSITALEYCVKDYLPRLSKHMMYQKVQLWIN